MPACCFAPAIEAKPGIFAAAGGGLEKEARQCGGQKFREEALGSANACVFDSAATAKIV
jgi:hypothetical protein